MDSSDDDARPSFFNKKKSDIYGVFADEVKSDSDEEPKRTKLTKKNFMNFQKSGHIVHDANKKVQVKISSKAQKKQAKFNQEEDEYSQSDISSQDNEKIIEERVNQFQRFNQPIKKKVKFQNILSSSHVKEQDMEQNYGKALNMMKNMGFDVNKGLGKNKQGIVNPVQAVEKKAMTSNFDLQVRKIGQNQNEKQAPQNQQINLSGQDNNFFSQIQAQEEEEEACVFVKHWQNDYYPRGQKQPEKKDEPLKIIDMRSNQDKEEQNNPLKKFMKIQKEEWLKHKFRYQQMMTKKREAQENLKQLTKEKEENVTRIEDIKKNKQQLLTFHQIIKDINISNDIELISKLTQKCFALDKELFNNYKIANYFCYKIKTILNDSHLEQIFNSQLKSIKQTLNNLFPNVESQNDSFYNKESQFQSKSQIIYSKIIDSTLKQKFIKLQNLDLDNILKIFTQYDELPLDFIQEYSQDQLIPKFNVFIDEYDFSQAIHTMINPFLPFFNDEQRKLILDKIYNGFMIKMNQQDILKIHEYVIPFKHIFQEEQWKNLILRQVIPKLLFQLNKVEINPSNQEIEVIEKVLQWVPALQNNQILLLFKNFFNKFKNTAQLWVNQGGDQEEMKIWIQGWEHFLPETIQQIFKQNLVQIKNILMSQSSQL